MKLLIPFLTLVFANDIKEELSGDEFVVAKSAGATFVKFYAPWCGHCKKMAPAWTELANEINGDEEWNVRIGSVDCTKYKKECADQGVTGYPTVKLFLPGQNGIKYQGQRTVDALQNWLDEQLPTGDEDEEAAEEEKSATQGKVVILKDENFAEESKGDKIVFVKFFAPWCGHCKKMAPTWIDLATVVADDDSIVIAEVDCTTSSKTCSSNSVTGYPTLKAFKNGKEIEKYGGGRDLSGFKAALARWKNVDEKPADAKPAAAKSVEAEPAASSDVIDLNEDIFGKTIATGSTFVKFYAPWCGHCKKLAPIWEELGSARANKQPEVKIAKIDCTKFNAICKENDVKGFPTLLFFQDGKNLGKHAGGRDLPSLEKSIAKFIDPSVPVGGKAEFAKKIAGKRAFVKFYAPWCGHCKRLAPAWEQLEAEYANHKDVVVFDVDCTEEAELCGEHGVKGYPTLKYYGLGAAEGEKYSGGRDFEALKAFVAGKLPKSEDHDEL